MLLVTTKRDRVSEFAIEDLGKITEVGYGVLQILEVSTAKQQQAVR
jgi:hypothetical protein